MTNVFVVYTPYHLYIVNKIINIDQENHLIIIDNKSDLVKSRILNKEIFEGITIIQDISKVKDRYLKSFISMKTNVNKLVESFEKVDNLYVFLDNNLIGQILINKFKYKHKVRAILLEDGTGLYIKCKFKLKDMLKKYIYKLFIINEYDLINQGENKNLDCIYCNFPNMKDTNIEIKKISDLYARDFKIDDFKYEADMLILTQPLSEDRIISKNEEIEFYKDIFNKYNNKKIYLKLHPRESMSKYKFISNYKNINLLEEFNLPVEAIIENINCDVVMSVSTSGILNIENKIKIYSYPLLNLDYKFDKLLRQFQDNETLFIIKSLSELDKIIEN
ncbi:alpha-2,8-polysialyltransferase family protein [Paraclostridium bifermentans]|uniref:alpha-2,8-polysialyltransferase family protein n=1 Tax=Paraclostridium bifermentans TaxID=1490 RepID=UPI001F47F31E|nr:alpha-2,8-polysialyltransferase family protein [Paraclostridium bifermentans]MCE9675720.1 alpha-2,8-polysialyltransferase family protein [Paraclostridium bifermentans]MCR1876252.1 alpha-2,8-polysialyltransferase family protein [Paraclostridium bifermentans]